MYQFIISHMEDGYPASTVLLSTSYWTRERIIREFLRKKIQDDVSQPQRAIWLSLIDKAPLITILANAIIEWELSSVSVYDLRHPEKELDYFSNELIMDTAVKCDVIGRALREQKELKVYGVVNAEETEDELRIFHDLFMVDGDSDRWLFTVVSRQPSTSRLSLKAQGINLVQATRQLVVDADVKRAVRYWLETYFPKQANLPVEVCTEGPKENSVQLFTGVFDELHRTLVIQGRKDDD